MKGSDLALIGAVAFGMYWLSRQTLSLSPTVNVVAPDLPTVDFNLPTLPDFPQSLPQVVEQLLPGITHPSEVGTINGVIAGFQQGTAISAGNLVGAISGAIAGSQLFLTNPISAQFGTTAGTISGTVAGAQQIIRRVL